MVFSFNPNALFGAIVNENPSLGDSALLYCNNFALGTETPSISNVNEFMKSGFINSFAVILPIIDSTLVSIYGLARS